MDSMIVSSERVVEDRQDDVLYKLSNIQLAGPANVVAPITRLPNEILAEIFHQGHISSQEDDVTFRSSISLVTAHWREVAIDTSSLWTRLIVQPYHSPEFVGMYLRRSKNCPLAVRFASSFASSDETSLRHLYAILPFLTLSAYRWRELIICLYDHEALQPILRSLRDLEAPLLETLTVEARYEPLGYAIHHIFKCGAPRLSDVYLGGLILLGPMNNVTTFHLNGQHQEFQDNCFYEVLEALPSITSLILQDMFIVYGHSRSRVPRMKLNMSSLRRLMIYAGHNGRSFLQKVLVEDISAPNLETLVIAKGCHETINNTFASLAATPLKFPALTSLELWKSFSSGVTPNFLQSHPNIKEFTLIKSGTDALELLLEHEGSPMLLPQLHTLTIQSIPMFSDSPLEDDPSVADFTTIRLLCELVATRTRLGIPIRRLRLNPHLYGAGPELIKRLQECVQVEDTGLAAPYWRQRLISWRKPA